MYCMQDSLVNKYNDRTWYFIIATLSIVVVGVVAFLIYHSQGNTSARPGIYILPKLNAFLNGSVAVLLTTGYIFIRNKNIKAHRFCMITAFVFSTSFLVSYILYHFNAVETKFGGTDHLIRGVYFFILITHITLATIIVPMTLLTLYRIWKNQVASHRKIAKWTLPIWLYVSVTGVIVYLMISPYYPV
jgi:putative membrane protein